MGKFGHLSIEAKLSVSVKTFTIFPWQHEHPPLKAKFCL